MWIGISADESAKRCKPSQEAWVTNRYPLRELGLTRDDCARWLWSRYQVVVPKSACIACPFHDDAYWSDMQLRSLVETCRFDETYLTVPGVRGECFVHSSCVPLPAASTFTRTRGEREALLQGQALLL